MAKEQESKEVVEEEAIKLSDAQREEIQSIVNGALGSHSKRTEKLIAEQLAKALEPLKQKPTEDADEPKGKAAKDGESKLQKELESMKARLDKAEKEKAAEIEARRRDAAQLQLRSHFEGIGVRKEALDVLVAASTVNGLLRYDEDGKPMLAVKRSRLKGSAAEEQTFEDFEQGIKDWSMTPEAAIFIKPTQGAKPNPGQSNGSNGSLPRYTKEAVSEEEKVDRVLDLMSRGTS